jgi:hypothetical protein
MPVFLFCWLFYWGQQDTANNSWMTPNPADTIYDFNDDTCAGSQPYANNTGQESIAQTGTNVTILVSWIPP